MAQLSEDEFATLFSEAYPRLWTVAAAMISDRTRADDLVQDAAISGLRRLKDFEPGTNFVAWMAQIVRYNALNHLKHLRRRKSEAAELHTIPEEHASGREQGRATVSDQGLLQPGQQQFDDQVVSALETLPPDRRACLLLRVVHGLTYDEIAEIVGLPAGTAMSHVHRAKAAMRGLLQRRDDEVERIDE